MPALQGSFYWWAVHSEITFSLAIQCAGLGLGSAVGAIATGLLIKFFNWQMSFYVLGMVMLAMSLLWILFADGKPEEGRKQRAKANFLTKLKIAYRMPDSEVQFILADRPDKKTSTSLRDVPWRKIFTTYQIPIAALAWFGIQYMAYNAANNMPTYLERAHGMSVPRNVLK